MKLVTVCGIWIAVVFVIFGVMASDHARTAPSRGMHWSVSDPVVDLPRYGDDDGCDESSNHCKFVFHVNKILPCHAPDTVRERELLST